VYSSITQELASQYALGYTSSNSKRDGSFRRIFVRVLTVVLSVFTLILIAEWEFFREFQSRFNQLAVRYFDHPTIVLGMIWYNYPVVRYLLGCLAVGAIVYAALRLATRIAYAADDMKARRPNMPAEVIGGFVVVFTLVFCSRGGFQHEPLRWGDAFKGRSEFANQMGLNGLYSLSSTALDMLTRGKAAGRWAASMPLPEARAVVRQMVLAPGEQLLDPQNRTVLRRGDSGSGLVLAPAGGKPLNVVVVMMESFAARFVGAVDG